jgi:nucleotide-binding universal stress UspA family protein
MEDAMFSPARILVPVDFSDSSRAAVACARDLARTFGSQLHLLHVISDPATECWGEFAPSGDVAARKEEWRRDAMFELEEFANEHGVRENANAICLAVLCASDPVRPIVSYASKEGCDLIVMGTHRTWGLTLTRSTGDGVRRRAACPVMLVPAKQAARMSASDWAGQQRDPYDLKRATC